MLQSQQINITLARLILQEMLTHPTDSPSKVNPKLTIWFAFVVWQYISSQIADLHDWYQISDAAKIQELCSIAIAENPKIVEQYKKGKTKVLYSLVGAIAKATDQKANLALVVEQLTETLKSK